MFHVGQPMNTHDEIDALPVGTVLIYEREGWRYTKQENGLWFDHTGHDPGMLSEFFTLFGENVIESLPNTPRPREAHMMETSVRMLMPLRYVESEERFSTYLDRNGEEVYLAHGTGKMLVSFDELTEDEDLRSRWTAFTTTDAYWQIGGHHAGFKNLLRDMVVDADEVDEVGFCSGCSMPELDDYLTVPNSSSIAKVCEPCLEKYHECDRCEEQYPYLTTVLDGYDLCQTCLGRHYSFCENCDGYYADTEGGHAHDGSDCCDSPAQSFTVRNDGEGALANDTRATIALGAGVITQEGLNEITDFLRNWSYSNMEAGEERNTFYQMSWDLDGLEERWQTKEGNYTKRLSRFAYKKYKIKLAADVVSGVGNIARAHSTGKDYDVEVTRNLNLPREEFAHDDSCWWTDYYQSRCAFKTNGGFGLRTFNEYDGVEGRAWVIPLRVDDDELMTLMPTFETLEPDAFVVFNGYGDLENYAPARIVSHMAGMTYRKIEFTCTPMYVNNSSGYLVAPEEIAEHYTDGRLNLSTMQHSDLFDIENANNQEKVLTNA